MELSEEKVHQAALSPPRNTRARIRASLLKQYDVALCNWQQVAIRNKEEREGYIRITLRNAQKSWLSGRQREMLNRAAFRKPKRNAKRQW